MSFVNERADLRAFAKNDEVNVPMEESVQNEEVMED